MDRDDAGAIPRRRTTPPRSRTEGCGQHGLAGHNKDHRTATTSTGRADESRGPRATAPVREGARLPWTLRLPARRSPNPAALSGVDLVLTAWPWSPSPHGVNFALAHPSTGGARRPASAYLTACPRRGSLVRNERLDLSGRSSESARACRWPAAPGGTAAARRTRRYLAQKRRATDCSDGRLRSCANRSAPKPPPPEPERPRGPPPSTCERAGHAVNARTEPPTRPASAPGCEGATESRLVRRLGEAAELLATGRQSWSPSWQTGQATSCSRRVQLPTRTWPPRPDGGAGRGVITHHWGSDLSDGRTRRHRSGTPIEAARRQRE